jgi:hypothetical protein
MLYPSLDMNIKEPKVSLLIAVIVVISVTKNRELIIQKNIYITAFRVL